MIEAALLESMPEIGEEPAFESPDDAGFSPKFVAFHLGSGLYGVAAEKVAEVSRPIELTPLPHSPNGLLGIIGVRDEIFAVVDLRTAIGETAPDPAARMKLVLLNPSNTNETRIGFLVDRMFEIVSADAELLDDRDDIIFANAETDAGKLGIIDPDKLHALLN